MPGLFPQLYAFPEREAVVNLLNHCPYADGKVIQQYASQETCLKHNKTWPSGKRLTGYDA